MKITLDTNIIYQALYSNAGASYAILKMIRASEIQIAISVPVFEEYRDVLCRPKTPRELGLSRENIERVLDFIVMVGVATPISYLWRLNLKDEAANMFVELAFASGSEYLVTRNIRDYTIDNELMLDSFSIATTSEFLEALRGRHGK